MGQCRAIATYSRMHTLCCRAKPKGNICLFTSKQIQPFGFAKQDGCDITIIDTFHEIKRPMRCYTDT